MRRGLLLFLAFGAVVRAAADNSAIAEAETALRDGLPHVAVHKLRVAGKFPEAEQARAAELLGQALFLAGRPEEAVEVLQQTAQTPAREFYLAESLASLGRWNEALKRYRYAAAQPGFSKADEALVGQARMLRAASSKGEATALLQERLSRDGVPEPVRVELARMELEDGHPESALRILGPASSQGGQVAAERNYLTASALAETGQADQAIALLKPLLGRNVDTTAGLPVLLAQCYLKKGDAARAEEVLESFIQDQARHPDLIKVFWELEKIYRMRKEVSETELRRWFEDSDEPQRRALALYFLGRNDARIGNTVRSQERLNRFITEYPDHPLAPRVRLELSQSLIASGDPTRARGVLNGHDERTDFASGMTRAAEDDYKNARTAFLAAAKKTDSEIAWYNAALCDVLLSTPEKDNVGWKRLSSRQPDGSLVKDLRFRMAQAAAGRREPGAEAMFRQLAQSNDPAVAASARLALAEWHYEQLDFPKAREEWRRVATEDPEVAARADALGVFLADTGDAASEADVIAKARAFIAAHPGNAFEPEVRMKLGEIFFRKGDYFGARDAFDELAVRFPDSPLAAKAQFFAADALSRSMDPAAVEEAIGRYEEVAQSGGDLALRARFAQAMLQNSLKRPDQALGVLDRILELKPEPDLRYAVLIEKGDTFFSLGQADPENFRRAIGTWDEIASDSAAPVGWKNQALYKIGTAHQNLGEIDAALSSYHDVLTQKQSGDPEYFWFYKAGFDAGQLLESRKRWNEAIAVYEKLAAADGPRAGEARSRISRIRLENFLWED